MRQGGMMITQLESFQTLQTKIGNRQQAVLGVIKDARLGGVTLFEIAIKLAWPINWVSGRVTELARAGFIAATDTKRINPRSGKRCAVWIALENVKYVVVDKLVSADVVSE